MDPNLCMAGDSNFETIQNKSIRISSPNIPIIYLHILWVYRLNMKMKCLCHHIVHIYHYKCVRTCNIISFNDESSYACQTKWQWQSRIFQRFSQRKIQAFYLRPFNGIITHMNNSATSWMNGGILLHVLPAYSACIRIRPLVRDFAMLFVRTT